MSDSNNEILNKIWYDALNTELTDPANYPAEFIKMVNDNGERLNNLFSGSLSSELIRNLTPSNMRIKAPLGMMISDSIKTKLKELPLFKGVLLNTFKTFYKWFFDGNNPSYDPVMNPDEVNLLRKGLSKKIMIELSNRINEVSKHVTATDITTAEMRKFLSKGYLGRKLKESELNIIDKIDVNKDSIGGILKDKYDEIPNKIIHTLKHLAEENKLSLTDILNKKSLTQLMRGNIGERKMIDRVIGSHSADNMRDNLRVPYDFVKYYRQVKPKIDYSRGYESNIFT